MPSLEQRLTGCVEIERNSALIEKGVELDLRLLGFDVGSPLLGCDELVADGVFDSQRDEVQAGEGTAARADLHLDGVGRSKPIGPGERIGGSIDIVLRSKRTLADFPEDAASYVRLQIDPIHGCPRGGKADASICLVGGWNAESVEFSFEYAFEAAWAGCKESLFCAIHAHSLSVASHVTTCTL